MINERRFILGRRWGLIILCLLVTLSSPVDVVASSPPPALGSSSVLSSSGAPIVSGWNYLKVDNVSSGVCSIKTVMDEIQADGGAALILDSLYVSSDGGNSFKEYSSSSPDSVSNKVSSNQIVAFSSDQKFFFDLEPAACTEDISSRPSDQARVDQIQTVREQSHDQGGGGLLKQLASIPQAFWQNLLGFINPFSGAPAAAPSLSSTDKADVEKLTSSSLFVSKQLTVGLLSLEPIGASISALTTLKIQPDPTLGGVDFLSGKVTISQDGTLGITKLSAPAGSIVGSSTLPAAATKVTIETQAVGKDSEVFLTPASPTDKVLSATNIQAGKSFDVVITSPSATDIRFNWWIVN